MYKDVHCGTVLKQKYKIQFKRSLMETELGHIHNMEYSLTIKNNREISADRGICPRQIETLKMQMCVSHDPICFQLHTAHTRIHHNVYAL